MFVKNTHIFLDRLRCETRPVFSSCARIWPFRAVCRAFSVQVVQHTVRAEKRRQIEKTQEITHFLQKVVKI